MKSHLLIAASAALAGSIALSPNAPAKAAITCEGAYQIINGTPHETPYCADNYIAQVARGYGMRVSNRTVRANPGLKTQICMSFGSDSRIRQLCRGHLPEDNGRIWQ